MDSFFNTLQVLKEENELGLFELEYARFVKRKEPKASRFFIHLVAFLANQFNKGSICIKLDQIKDTILSKRLGLYDKSIQELKGLLSESDLVGKPGEYVPIILEEERLYFHKYWSYEEELTQWIKSRVANSMSSLSKTTNEDLQDLAVHKALNLDFLIITGGPGTGKTFTVKRIIEALKKETPESQISICAPTGKASERLNEVLRDDYPDIQSQTIHKLLKAQFNGDFRYNEDNKLSSDVLIIDEASMLDIRLWIAVTRAIKRTTKLILLGDKDQLASVEAGSVLGDICNSLVTKESTDDSSRLSDHLVFLKKSYRSEEGRGIPEFAELINSQNYKAILSTVDGFEGVNFIEPEAEKLNTLIEDYCNEIIQGSTKSQILCTNRKGRFGTERLNELIESKLKKMIGVADQTEWYQGKRILITQNHMDSGISNGEIGICIKNQDDNFEIQFLDGKLVQFSQLKYYESAYAITVHKSQGSEFERVVVFLAEQYNQVLTKEILYTSVTRARRDVLVVGNKEVLMKTVSARIVRSSGISQKIVI